MTDEQWKDEIDRHNLAVADCSTRVYAIRLELEQAEAALDAAIEQRQQAIEAYLADDSGGC
jgi:hypothetical protein